LLYSPGLNETGSSNDAPEELIVTDFDNSAVPFGNELKVKPRELAAEMFIIELLNNICISVFPKGVPIPKLLSDNPSSISSPYITGCEEEVDIITGPAVTLEACEIGGG
jgi:hypothetical protein